MGETELVDGTTVAYPAHALKLADGAPSLENRGVVPHVPVEATPHDATRGCDTQLEAAAAKAMALVAERQLRLAAEAAERERAASAAAAKPAHTHWSKRAHT
jgi:C-terminal processing protease CtpA/Prc